jgi:hypothetical protein
VPLSEHEQRLLEQMEKALYAEDPKFATSLRSSRGAKASRGRAALGVLALLSGMGLLLAGVTTTIIALGVLGFVVMLVGAVIIYSAFQSRGAAPAAEGAEVPPAQGPTGSAGGSTGGSAGGSSGFMDRMEDRWRRRTEEGQ